MTGRTAFVCAGGTGGHLFPAAALSGELRTRGWRVLLLTDDRAEKWSEDFPAEAVHRIPSATFGSKNPVALLRSLARIVAGTAKAAKWARRLKPAVVVGFGGYPTLPPVLGAHLVGVPTVIHEQNAVAGRANRVLSRFVTAIAGGFLADDRGAHAAKTITTGNPVRPPVIAAAATPFAAPGADEPFNLLVFGGSQGAQFFSTAIPAAVALLPEAVRARLNIVHQARNEDMEAARAGYARAGVEAELAAFFTDMPARIAAAHFVICRSGASTVSEIAAIGRPALFVPYPHALDHDQAANAAKLAETGGVEVARQDSLTPENIAARLTSAMDDPAGLTAKAKAARSAGRTDAAALLADLVEAIAAGTPVSAFKAGRALRG